MEDRLGDEVSGVRAQSSIDEPPDGPRTRSAAAGSSHDRVRQLLEVVVGIGGGLDLETALTRIVQAAVTLVDAKYGALGVLDGGQRLARFITVGLDAGQIAGIGPYPEGRGLLGELIRHPVALRAEDLARHPQSSGFPANHPPMHSFLGVPIRVRTEVFGNLYMTEKQGGAPFDADDETVLTALAAAAGVAIDNARLYDDARRRQEWLEATSELARGLLSGRDLEDVLAWFRATGRDLRAGGSRPRRAAGRRARGPDDRRGARARRRTAARRGGRGGGFVDRLGVRVRRGRARPRPARRRARPVRSRARPGARPRDAAAARRAGLRARRARAGARGGGGAVRRVGAGARLRPRRAGRGGTGACRPQAGQRDALAVRGPRPDRAGPARPGDPKDGHGARAQVIEACERVAEQLGFSPSVRFTGPVDTLVSEDVAEHLAAVLREALSNAARHARAAKVDVEVAVDGSNVTLTVIDDGVGIPAEGRRSGLANLAERAQQLGGSFTAHPGASGGTILVWSAPTEHDED